ncbi:MAG: cytochrome o ubiquinol oxidase subunit III [Desulfobacterales bacterium]|jgi:cytochrome o ubiquinol oxidase subunit 3
MTTDASTINAVQTEEPEHPDIVGNHIFGFWLYLMTDLVLFAAIFATFAVVGRNYAGGPTGKELFDLRYLFVETMFLLCSSAAYGLVVLAMQKDSKGWVLVWLVVTAMLGAGFILMEVNEFYHMIIAGNGPQRSAFLSGFFTLVGTHGTHVSFGLIWMAVMIGQVDLNGLTLPVRSRLMRLSMFWHFLDIVWVGVFTIVYLMGVVLSS